MEWKSAGPLATDTQSLPNLFTLFYVILTFPAHLCPPFSFNPACFRVQLCSLSSATPWSIGNSYRSPPGTDACALSNWLAWRLPAALLSVQPLGKRGHKNSREDDLRPFTHQPAAPEEPPLPPPNQPRSKNSELMSVQQAVRRVKHLLLALQRGGLHLSNHN